jgi:hypothetical protein
MQRHACAADLFGQSFAARLEFFEIRRPNRLVCCSSKNYVRHLEIAHGSIVRCRKRIDLFRDAQRRLSGFIVWTDITDHGRINRIPEND